MTFSITQKSQFEGASRIDAEYYQPEFLVNASKLNKYRKLKKLFECAFITSGPAYSSLEMADSFSIPLARIGDVTGKTDINNWIKLSSEEFEKFGSKAIKDSDLIMTMTGDPPDVGKTNIIYGYANEVLAFNQRVAKLTSKIGPFYLFAFLSTESARLQSERNAFGIRQRNLSTPDLRNTLVAIPDVHMSLAISKLVQTYLQTLEESKSVFRIAENLLLEKIGLLGFKISEDLSYIVNYSHTEKVDRVDADFFQPKYQIISEKIKTNNAKPLGELASLKKGFEPGSEAYQEEGKLFIRVSSLSKFGIENKDQKYLSDELYQKLRSNYEPKVGEILLTKDASPGISYVVKEPIEGIISSGILRLKLKSDIEPEYLSLCIGSLIGQMQAERDAGGSVIVHWKPEQIKNILIPVLPKEIQSKIADLVKKSHEALKKSKELLESAKRKVEEMIEKGGETNGSN